MKLINEKGVEVLAGDKNAIIFQAILYFECNDFWIDFENKTFSILGVGGEIVDE